LKWSQNDFAGHCVGGQQSTAAGGGLAAGIAVAAGGGGAVWAGRVGVPTATAKHVTANRRRDRMGTLPWVVGDGSILIG